MSQLILGTSNPAKSLKLRELVQGLSLDLIDGSGQILVPKFVEAGDSHVEVAIQKAIIWSRSASVPVISSDGGLEIPSLGSRWSSIHTKRQTGPDGASDSSRTEILLKMLKGKEGDKRLVYRTEAVAVAVNGQLLAAWQAHGSECFIADEAITYPSQHGGFWLESVLLGPDGQRWWQMSSSEMEKVKEPWVQLKKPVQEFLAVLY